MIAWRCLRQFSPGEMKRFLTPILPLLAGLAAITGQGRADDWTTVGADAQRSGWVRADLKISRESVAGPDFQFLWRIPTSNVARSGSGLSVPVLIDFLISHRGFRSLAFVGGSGGGIFVMDTDLARMEWERHFAPGPGETTPDCPGGMTTSLSRQTALAMPSMLGIGARGRRTPAVSAVGRPGQGAVTLGTASAPRPVPTRNAGAARQQRTRPPARPALRGVTLVYAVTASGELHSLYVSNGRDHIPPIPFLPQNAHARGLTVTGNTAFVVTTNGCAGVPDGVWSLDLDTRIVRTWESEGGAIAGTAGMAFGPDGTIFASTREGPLVSLEPRSMRPTMRSRTERFRSSAVVFDSNDADHVAAVTADGVLQVYAAASLREPVTTAELGSDQPSSDTALAAWRDVGGTRWILAPTGGGVGAWKLTDNSGGLALERGWEYGGLANPLPPIVVNGVVFVLDGGSAESNARLHALDGQSGRPIWDSGSTIQAQASGHMLSSGPGHVFLTALDNAVYAFGLPMEH